MTRASLFAGLVLGSAMLVNPGVATAEVFDGAWNVLIVTESGTCDRGFRYDVKVGNGRVAYAGNASIDLSGTVAANGAVKVNISKGDQSAAGTGKLSATTGAGTWRGRGSAGECQGIWQAERRG